MCCVDKSVLAGFLESVKNTWIRYTNRGQEKEEENYILIKGRNAPHSGELKWAKGGLEVTGLKLTLRVNDGEIRCVQGELDAAGVLWRFHESDFTDWTEGEVRRLHQMLLQIPPELLAYPTIKRSVRKNNVKESKYEKKESR